MKENSRTENSIRNTVVAVIAQVFCLLLAFVTRVVFTRVLNEAYMGINGLFTDILYVLSFSELGVGTAISYALYKPIAEQDIEKQKTIMRFYRNVFRVLSILITAAGLLVIPFLKYLVTDADGIAHITLIYLLYLANTVLSYQVIYKKALIDAHQLSYITTLYHLSFLMLQYVLQTVFLLLTGNFILYLLLYLACTFGGNVAASAKADKMYPYLRDKTVLPMEAEEKKSIYKNIKAMMMHKIGNVVVNNTDNLLISGFVSVLSVGSYSNYYLLIGSVHQLLGLIFQGIVASVGNLGVTENPARIRKIYESTFFLNQWVYGFAFVCMYELLSLFVGISFGESYVFEPGIVFVLCINFYLNGMRQSALAFRDSLGVFWYDRYKSLVEGGINLVASLLLVRQMGIIGVCIGTTISTVTTSLWVEPYMLYKHRLQAPCIGYFARYGLYFAVTLVILFVTNRICGLVGGSAFAQLIGRLVICLLVPNLIMLLIYHKTKEFRFLKEKAIAYVVGLKKTWLKKSDR